MQGKSIEVLSAEQAREMIRGAGLRATAGRIETLRFLAAHVEPVTHKVVHEEFAGVDRITAWRNLRDLAKAGIATRADLGDHRYRYWYGRAERFDLITGLRNVPIPGTK